MKATVATPNLGFQIDPQLNALILRECRLTPWKSKSAVIRERLRTSYQEHPLPRRNGKGRVS